MLLRKRGRGLTPRNPAPAKNAKTPSIIIGPFSGGTILAIEGSIPCNRCPTEQTLSVEMYINDACRRQGLFGPILHPLLAADKVRFRLEHQ